jgi:hypothetical protein
LYPTQNILVDDDDDKVITSNVNKRNKMCGIIMQPKKPEIPLTHAMADTGAILIFVLKGTPTKNIRSASQPLTINLPNGTVV